MPIEFDSFSKNAKGGTEIIKKEVIKRIPKDLLDNFQIVCDRVGDLEENKIRIYWSHLNPTQNEGASSWLGVDPKPLANGGWSRFHKIVFISYHQMENWISKYNIPRSHCTVIKHAINPIPLASKPKDKIVLVYHSNPSRGLDLLVDVFIKLCEEYDNIELKVHSSWTVYGMQEWQKEFESSDVYWQIQNHPKIKNIGYLPNEEVKKSLASSHIFAYPNTYIETFCLSLLEAMSAGCLCVHPNYGCLPETSANWTLMYDYHEARESHKNIFYETLKKSIDLVNKKETQQHLLKQKEYVDYLFNWDTKTKEWINLLTDLKNKPSNKVTSQKLISYK